MTGGNNDAVVRFQRIQDQSTRRATPHPLSLAATLFLVLDFAFTEYVLSIGGSEANPVMDWIITEYGVLGHVGIRATQVAAVLAFGFLHAPRWTWGVLVATYAVPVAWGAYLLILYHVVW